MNMATKIKKDYKLNQGQQHAGDEFMNFLFDSNQKELIISGAAGVGKTYLMNYIIDETMPRYHEMCALIGVKPEFDNVEMTATTNKAADVLSQAVKRATRTVHSFFNLIVKDNFQTGKSEIIRTAAWVVHQNKIIFIDESSMIDTELWTALQEGTMNCKLVYVGDRHQLAPIHEDLSPVYKHNSPMVELLEPVRNAGQPALMNICAQLRHTVATGEFYPIQEVPGVIDILGPQQMEAEVYRHFKEQTDKSRILAYTNKRVIEYNDHVRAIRGLSDSFTVGEFLVCNSVYHHGRKGQVPVETELEVTANHGPSKVLLDEATDTWLDVELLNVRTKFGDLLYKVPVPANKAHFDQLKKYYVSVKNWKMKFQLQNNYADLRPREAATVHKSQGSTYDSVFIDLGNISTNHKPKEVARMLYVAFSRARSRIYLYGDLAPKYGGLLR